MHRYEKVITQGGSGKDHDWNQGSAGVPGQDRAFQANYHDKIGLSNYRAFQQFSGELPGQDRAGEHGGVNGSLHDGGFCGDRARHGMSYHEEVRGQGLCAGQGLWHERTAHQELPTAPALPARAMSWEGVEASWSFQCWRPTQGQWTLEIGSRCLAQSCGISVHIHRDGGKEL